ncbi:MAG: glucose 1-dehydrogenase [Deltaproteobacteria bacterium]|nr:glucose 1-dehydrogenase [Deltaproteobacteria bacterium]
MKDMFSLQDRVAIVTGGNRGIGLGIARGFAEAGSHIVIAARDQAKTAEAAKEIIDEFGVRVLGLQVDVLHEDQIQAAAEQTQGEFGRIDILVNNAGICIAEQPQDHTTEDWDQALGINLRGPFLWSKMVYPTMKAAHGGKIINIGSMYSLFGQDWSASYGASKGGIVQLTRSLAVAWAPDNIQVNAILPGWINTDMTRQGREQFPEMEERIISGTPADRWGEPEDLAGAALLLASRASDFITGTTIAVDGGYSICA